MKGKKTERKETKSDGCIRNVKPGMEMDVEETSDDRKKRITRKYRVVEAYPHVVLTVDRHGIRRCFNKGQLVQMGLEE